MYYLGVDIGGTNVKAGLINEKGQIVKKSSIETDRSFDYKIIVKDIAAQLIELLNDCGVNQKEVKGIGIGSPGAINSKAGAVDYANNLNWKDIPLVAEFKKYFDLTVKVCNDANVAALGEAKFGAGKAFSSSIFITLGTGVGGGVIIDGKLFEGNQSKGAELGHTVIMHGGQACSCGRHGCLEAYASATALIRDTKIAMNLDKDSSMWGFVGGDISKVDGRTAFECSKTGDYSAKKVVNKYIEYLGVGLCDFVNIFRPEAIILGGGVCAQGDYLINPLKKIIQTESYGSGEPKVDLLTAKLGNDAGLVGGACLVME